MTRLLTLIFLSIFAYSCSTKKAVTSTVNDLKVDSVYKEKKDSVSFRKNSVVITEDVYEMEIVPIDSTKPIFIDDKEYKNAAIKIKKSEKSFVDSTQVTVLESLDKNIEVEKNSITKNYWISVCTGNPGYYRSAHPPMQWRVVQNGSPG